MDAATQIKITFSDLLKILLPMLWSFLAAKIIVQTDVIMLAPLGTYALAAFAIPMRVMIIDIIAAFAIAPVIGVIISSAKTENKRHYIIKNAFSLSLYLSLILTGIGLVFYPQLVTHIINNFEIAFLAKNAIFWLTMAIPARLIQFVCTMIFFATKRGNYLLPIYLGSIIANGILDWLLIYFFKMGFSGSYLSTFFVSYLEVFYTLFLLRKNFSILKIFQPPNMVWVKKLFSQISSEFARLVSWQFLSFTILLLFSLKLVWVLPLSIYAVAMEFYVFLTIPLIAVMRAIAILLAKYNKINGIHLYWALKKIAFIGFILTFMISILLILSGNYFGENIYHLNKGVLSLWKSFIWLTALGLPLYFLNSLQRGVWQSQQKYQVIFLLELFLSWPISIFTVYYGLVTRNYWVLWSGTLIIELLIALFLFYCRKKINANKDEFVSALPPQLS